MARKRVKQQGCPNCGHALVPEDNYCARCGQENHTHKLPVRHYLVELLSGLFNFDTKLLHTLRDLFWPPGLVIREFNANRRARYVPPLRLYLFTSVLFFILLAWTSSHHEQGDRELVKVNQPGEKNNAGLTLNFGKGSELSDSALVALSERRELTDAAIDSALVALDVEPGFWTRVAVRMGINANANANSTRKSAYVQGIIASFSKLMFVLLPLFALFLYVLHWKSGMYFTEHLVFTLYFHTVAYLIIGLRVLLGSFVDLSGVDGLPVLLAVIYLFWAMRTVYPGRWWVTLMKAFALLVLYLLFVSIGFGIAAVLGSFGT